MSMMVLPTELVTDILTRLPGKQVGRCKSVCKTFRETIRSRQFIEIYRKRHRGLMLLYWWEYMRPGGLYKRRFRFFHSPLRRPDEPPEEFSPLPELVTDGGYEAGAIFGVTQVIDGLLCTGEEFGSDLRLTLRNICTGEAMRVPDPPPCDAATVSTYHLGYDRITRLYKLLRIVLGKDGRSVKGVHILTLTPPFVWRGLDGNETGFSRFLFTHNLTRELGSFGESGWLCWVETYGLKGDRLLCFDLHTERSRLIDCPGMFMSLYAVTRFQDSLALWIRLAGKDYTDQDELWRYVLEDDAGKKWSRRLAKDLKNYRARLDDQNLLLSSTADLLELNRDDESWSVRSYSTLDAEKEKDDDALFVGKLPHGSTHRFEKYNSGSYWSNRNQFRNGRLIRCMDANLYLPLADVWSGGF